jgi:hypothetical protein
MFPESEQAGWGSKLALVNYLRSVNVIHISERYLRLQVGTTSNGA